jgi:hypothetical protein
MKLPKFNIPDYVLDWLLILMLVVYNQYACVAVYLIFKSQLSLEKYIAMKTDTSLEKLNRLEAEIKSLVATQNIRNNLGGR